VSIETKTSRNASYERDPRERERESQGGEVREGECRGECVE